MDTLLGDPITNAKNSTHKAKVTKPKEPIGIDDIGIFEFMFEGLPNLPDLEGIDEDRLFELQNAVQEQAQKGRRKRKKYYKKSTRV